MATLPSITKEEPDLAGTLVHYAVLSLLGPAWYCCGLLAQRAKLPQITGYVIGGIICGPSGESYGPFFSPKFLTIKKFHRVRFILFDVP
jgi:Kef-type K+ transport system membrane component KefB